MGLPVSGRGRAPQRGQVPVCFSGQLCLLRATQTPGVTRLISARPTQRSLRQLEWGFLGYLMVCT